MTLPKLDERLTELEQLFESPPLTPELVAAIKLIAPQFDLSTSEESRVYWQADQNGSSWGEYEALKQLFGVMPKPGKVLDIGPGLGRSMVFFKKKLNWENSEFHAFEGQGKDTKYTILGPRFDDSFCGNISMLRHVLEYNKMKNVTIFDAEKTQMAQLPGDYDFLYSFYSIGFHWSLEHFLQDILKLMHDTSLAVFTVPNEFEPFLELELLSYKIVDWKTVWPRDGLLKLLIIGKTSIPDF